LTLDPNKETRVWLPKISWANVLMDIISNSVRRILSFVLRGGDSCFLSLKGDFIPKPLTYFFVLIQESRQRTYFMIIATLDNIQASLILFSLNAIIQDLASLRSKNYGSFIEIVKTHLTYFVREIQTETIFR